MCNNTIAALATPYKISAIAIIRISGNDALEIVDKFYVSKSGKMNFLKNKKNNFRYGYFQNNNKKLIDECIFLINYAPKSYTGENMVEIQCHGSIVIIDEILKTLYSAGVIAALPGEFTKRAFMNQKLNLIQSEAVSDLISSVNIESAQNALSQLTNDDTTKIFYIREQLLNIAANFYAIIDFPDEEIQDINLENIYIKINNIKKYFAEVIENNEKHNLYIDGIICSIIGSPNVGKSSLLNELLKKDRAIVTEIAGTTRDIIEDYLKIGNCKIRLNDTAGLRNTQDIIEKIGIDKTLNKLKESDLILFMINNNKEISFEEKNYIKKLNNEKTILIINKCDLERKIDINFLNEMNFSNYIEISIKKKENISLLKEAIIKKINLPNFNYNGEIITNRRHISIITQCIVICNDIIKSINNKFTLDVIINDVEFLISKLGEITGDTVTDDIINNIFKNFCVGK